MRAPTPICCILSATLLLINSAWSKGADDAAAAPGKLSIEPVTVTLVGPDDVQRLLVTLTNGAKTHDKSRSADFVSSDPKIATVTKDGVVHPTADGTVEVRATVMGQTAVVPVTVKDFGTSQPVSFRNQVLPIFTRLGCNAGGCHGKASGQGGFKLSLFGFDPDVDYDTIVRGIRGRRIFPAAPEFSLLLQKATGAVPHGGGRRIRPDSESYHVVARWLRQGTPAGGSSDRYVKHIVCTPSGRIMTPDAEQQLLVTAYYSDESQRDVTHEAQFRSNQEHVAVVDEGGLGRTMHHTGDSVVMARYMGHVAVCTLSVPMPDRPGTPAPKLAVQNYIDKLVQAKWQRLQLTPSPLADDASFLRRAYLDGIGTLPTLTEIKDFLADPDANKRAKWVERILDRPEYADFWAVKWGDLLRNKRRVADWNHETFTFHGWIRQALARNMPYDRFVRAIITAQGTAGNSPPVVWYRELFKNGDLSSITNDTSQLFLGVRLNCAQCHHHPYEKWGQDDYNRLGAFFGRVQFQDNKVHLRPQSEAAPKRGAKGRLLTPRALDGDEITVSDDEDPREKLVDWMVKPDNPFFARAIANRIWAHFMGRGLVDPVDDMRVTNPPSNPELLDALAKDLIDHQFDLKHLMRTVMVSTTYQLSSEPDPGNAHDRQNYARAYPRRLRADVLLDAVCQVTGVAEQFPGLPKGTRAIELPDESVPSHFLDVFGRPGRESACECERSSEGNLAQALQMLNAANLQGKICDANGRLGRLLQDPKPDEKVIEELYLTALARPASAEELKAALEYIAEPNRDRKVALEDLFWAVLNTKEFLFNH